MADARCANCGRRMDSADLPAHRCLITEVARHGFNAAEAQELIEREGEPPLCWCGKGYVGHTVHPENELRSMGGDR